MTSSSSLTISPLAIDSGIQLNDRSSYYIPTILYTCYIPPPVCIKARKCLNQRVVVCVPPPTLLLAQYHPAIAPVTFLGLHKYFCMYKTHHITSPGSASKPGYMILVGTPAQHLPWIPIFLLHLSPVLQHTQPSISYIYDIKKVPCEQISPILFCTTLSSSSLH